jgi:cephalosporin hydroxylase
MLKNLLKKSEYKDAALNENCGQFEVNNWIISDFVVNRLVPVAGVHPFPLSELMLMSAAVCRFKPALIFEWGTNIGKSARIFYEIAQAFRIDAQIHSIDLPDDVFHSEHPKKDRGKMVRGIGRVTLHQADGLERSLEIWREKQPKGRVLFFVDGDHSYESVKKELETILTSIPTAAVLLHDTFYQSPEAGYNVGPHKAINDVLAANRDLYEVIATNTGLPGMTLVYRK